MQRLISWLRAEYRDEPGALAEREPRVRVWLRWLFGHAVRSWEEIPADLLIRYWEGRILPVHGMRAPSRSVRSAQSRRRAVSAAMQGAVELGYVDADSDAALACRKHRGLGIAEFASGTTAVKTAIDSWSPRGWPKSKQKALHAIVATVRSCVEAAEPPNARSARTWMRPVADLTASVYLRDGNLDLDHIFHAESVAHWVAADLKGVEASTRRTKQSVIWRVGRAVAPAVTQRRPRPIGKVKAPKIYSAAEEDSFRQAAALEWPKNHAEWKWLVGSTLGGGLTGVEAEALGPGDVAAVGAGRLKVHVAGANPRWVPIRADYTELVRDAVRETSGQRFMSSSVYGSAANLAKQLHVEGLGSLSLRRARVTWIAAQLRADVSLRSLRRFCGPVHKDTLDALLRQAAEEMDDDEAVLKGLGA